MQNIITKTLNVENNKLSSEVIKRFNLKFGSQTQISVEIRYLTKKVQYNNCYLFVLVVAVLEGIVSSVT